MLSKPRKYGLCRYHVKPEPEENREVGYAEYPYAWRNGLPIPPKPRIKPPKGKEWAWRRIKGQGSIWRWVARRPCDIHQCGSHDLTGKWGLHFLTTGLAYLRQTAGRTKGMVCERCIRGVLRPPERRCPEYTEELGRTCPILQRFAEAYTNGLMEKPHIAATLSPYDLSRLVRIAVQLEYALWCVEEVGQAEQITRDDGGVDYRPTESAKMVLTLTRVFENTWKGFGLQPKDVLVLTEAVKKADGRTQRERMLSARIIEALPSASEVDWDALKEGGGD